METNFAPCLTVLLDQEGGFSDDPEDPGGATNHGITLKELARWRRAPQTIANVQALTVADVGPIYHADYWNVARCPVLPVGLDLMVFDECVNEGPGQAARSLQEALGVIVDGDVGPKTLAAASSCDVSKTLIAIGNVRDAYYRALPGFHHDGTGWLDRVERVLEAAQHMAQPPAKV